MHKINKARLLAGLPIDASYERQQSNQSVVKEPTEHQSVQKKTIIETINESFGDISSLSHQELNNIAINLESKLDEIHSLIESSLSEAKVFKKGTDVEDKKGRCYKVVKVIGTDEHDEPVYKVVCPKTGEMSTKPGMSLQVSAKKESVSTTAVPVVEEVKVDVLNTENNAEQPKTPADVLPKPQKTKVPSHVAKDMKDAIATHENDVKVMKTRDEANAMFHEQIVDAFKKLEELMHNDIKQAQLFMTSLMGPIFHKIPSSVCKFVYSGGDKSLKTYFNK